MTAAALVSACASLDGLAVTDEDGALPDAPETPRRGDRDAAVLEGEPVPGSEPTFCDTRTPTFCADFDREPLAGWSTTTRVHGDVRGAPGGTSAPTALLVTTDATGPGVVARAYARKDLPAPAKEEIAYAFDVRLGQIGATGGNGGSIAVLQLGAPPADVELQLNVAAGGSASFVERGPSLEGGPRTYTTHPMPALRVGQFTHVEIRVRTKSLLTVAIDGVTVFDALPMATPLPIAPPVLYLGVTYADPPSGSWNVAYDSLVVDVR